MEGPRDPVAVVTGRPLVFELTVVATEGPLVSGELGVVVTGSALVPLKVSKEVNVPVVSVTGLAVVTGGSLDTSDSRSGTVVSKISWKVLVSGTEMLTLSPMRLPKEDNSVVPKEGEEDGVGVCLQVLVVSSGPTVTGLVVFVELIFKVSEVLRTLACGIDAVAVAVVCISSGLTTWVQTLPRRRKRSRAIFDRQEQELGPV